MNNPDRLREELARRLRRSCVANGMWEYLVEEDWVRDAVDMSLPAGAEFLFNKVRAIETAVRPERGDAVELHAPRDATAGARIDALSAIYAAWAARDAVWFRRRHLMRADDRTVFETCATGGPYSGYTLLDEDAVAAWVMERLRDYAAGADPDRYIVGLIERGKPGDRARVAHLDFVSDGRPVRQTVPRHGALGELAELSQKLAKNYRWHPAWASLFVLAGTRPTVLAYTASAQISYGIEGAATTRVTLTVDPALPPQQVAELYGQIRTAMQPEPAPRAQSLRSYRLAEHVGPHLLYHPVNPQESNRRGRPRKGNLPGTFAYYVDPVDCTWQDLRRTWNSLDSVAGEDGKPWRYDSQSNFTRDAQRAFLRLLDPRWSPPSERRRPLL